MRDVESRGQPLVEGWLAGDRSPEWQDKTWKTYERLTRRRLAIRGGWLWPLAKDIILGPRRQFTKKGAVRSNQCTWRPRSGQA